MCSPDHTRVSRNVRATMASGRATGATCRASMDTTFHGGYPCCGREHGSINPAIRHNNKVASSTIPPGFFRTFLRTDHRFPTLDVWNHHAGWRDGWWWSTILYVTWPKLGYNYSSQHLRCRKICVYHKIIQVAYDQWENPRFGHPCFRNPPWNWSSIPVEDEFQYGLDSSGQWA